MFQSPKSGHIVCNRERIIKQEMFLEFQSPKSGHIVCNLNDWNVSRVTNMKFQSPKSGHIVCNV